MSSKPPTRFDRRLELVRMGIDPDARAPELRLNPELEDVRHSNSQDVGRIGRQIKAVAKRKGISASQAADIVLNPQPQEERP